MTENRVSMKPRNMTSLEIYPDPESLGEALAGDILRGLADSTRKGRRFLLGCPAGRSQQRTLRALGRLAARKRQSLANLVVVMMDDYVLRRDGRWIFPSANAHFSCHRYAQRGVLRVLNHGQPKERRVSPENVWFPDPAAPRDYDRRLKAAGGVDLFLLASGTSDGHVAFNRPGSRADSPTRILRIADATRRDNMATFPRFRTLSEVPRHGVSVGLGTIARLSKAVALIIHGEAKQRAVRTLLSRRRFRRSWPVSIIYRCRRFRILLDTAAAGTLAR